MNKTDDNVSPNVLKLQRVIASRRADSVAHKTLEPEIVCAELVTALEEDRLTVFVGAGASYANGIPTWSRLIADLASKLVPEELQPAFDILASFDNPLISARYLKSLFAFSEGLPVAVHSELYKNYAVDMENQTLRLIERLAQLSNDIGNSLKIVNYNFDDLIQNRFRSLDIDSTTIYDQATNTANGSGIKIYHVHGIVPYDSKLTPVKPQPNLVLSEDDFHVLMSDAKCWQNLVQAELLSSNVCIFIGLSMTDPNLRRIVDHCACELKQDKHPKRYIVTRKHAAGDTLLPDSAELTSEIAEGLNFIKSGLFRELGAEPFYISDFEDIAKLTDHLFIAN